MSGDEYPYVATFSFEGKCTPRVITASELARWLERSHYSDEYDELRHLYRVARDGYVYRVDLLHVGEAEVDADDFINQTYEIRHPLSGRRYDSFTVRVDGRA